MTALSLQEILPNIASLPRVDKLRLIRRLTEDLEREETGAESLLSSDVVYPVWTPLPETQESLQAPMILTQMLEKAKGAA
jgi:hypothetical protein